MLKAKQPPGNVGRFFARRGLLPGGASGTERFLFFFLAPGALHTWSRVLQCAHIRCSVKRDGRCARSRQEGDYNLAEVRPDPGHGDRMGFMAAKHLLSPVS